MSITRLLLHIWLLVWRASGQIRGRSAFDQLLIITLSIWSWPVSIAACADHKFRREQYFSEKTIRRVKFFIKLVLSCFPDGKYLFFCFPCLEKNYFVELYFDQFSDQILAQQQEVGSRWLIWHSMKWKLLSALLRVILGIQINSSPISGFVLISNLFI